MKKLFLLCSIFLNINIYAQISLTGTEPASIRWNYIETPIYKIIYPQGLDSLARVYATNLELVSESSSYSEGYKVNEEFTKKWPVIIHPYSSNHEGLVTWPSHKADIYTTPKPYAPMPLPWERVMAINESRRISQIQFSYDSTFSPEKFLFGELSLYALASLYGGDGFHEGDALLAKTALTTSGEGRTADFLENMRSLYTAGKIFDSGKFSYGSIKDYVPTRYQSDYIYHSGMRAYYKVYDYAKQYYDLIKKKKGIVFFIEDTMAQKISGEWYEDEFQTISKNLAKEWVQNDSLRAPFMPYKKCIDIKGLYTDYSKFQIVDNKIFTVRWGLAKPYEIVHITSDGKEITINEFSEKTSSIKYSPLTKNLYWSETIPDVRWEQELSSDIRYLDSKGHIKTLTRSTRYFNPVPNEDKLAVVHYSEDGKSSIKVLDIYTGDVLDNYPAPDGLQVVEVAWIDNQLFASGITLDGFSIYSVTPRHCEQNDTGLPRPEGLAKTDQSTHNDDNNILIRHCERNEVECGNLRPLEQNDTRLPRLTARNDELYTPLLPPTHTKVKQLWSHNGIIMFTCDRTTVNELYSFNPNTKELLQITNTQQGAADFVIHRDSLYFSSLEPSGRYICATALKDLKPRKANFEELSTFPMSNEIGLHEDIKIVEDKEVSISEPKPYSKFNNFIKVHSWLPFYLHYDALENLSFDNISNDLGLGFTVFSQNDLGTAYGYAAYHAIPKKPRWKHAAEISYTYAGFYPVLETKLKFNERDKIIFSDTNTTANTPHFNAFFRAYIPFNFSRGGWERGLIPSVSYSITNDSYLDNGLNKNANCLEFSIRTYTIQSTPYARTFPRLGIGTEFSYHLHPDLMYKYKPNLSARIYGYLPGIGERQGLKIELNHNLINTSFCKDDESKILPRGFETKLAYELVKRHNSFNKISFDYSIPFASVDWSFLWQSIYLRNFELIPHFDYCIYSKNTTMWSAGTEVLAVLFDGFKIGLAYNYLSIKDHSFELALTLDL